MSFHTHAGGYTVGRRPAPKTMNKDLLAALMALIAEYREPQETEADDTDIQEDAVNANALRPRGLILNKQPAAKPSQSMQKDGPLLPRRLTK